MAMGKIHPRILTRVIDVYALMTKKPKGGHRPLGFGTAWRRAVFSCVASQKNSKWDKDFTSAHPDDLREQNDEVLVAQQGVRDAHLATASAASTSSTESAVNAKIQLIEAEAHLTSVAAPRRFPTNLCFSPRGSETLIHTVRVHVA